MLPTPAARTAPRPAALDRTPLGAALALLSDPAAAYLMTRAQRLDFARRAISLTAWSAR